MQGWYYDPRHGGCLRRITRCSPVLYRIKGVYGNDEAMPPHTKWHAFATVQAVYNDTMTVRVDFAGKPGRGERFLGATFDGRDLRWDDGNVWKGMYVHGSQLF